ncbi:uncharacterized protein PAF06_000039 [Gastrophryne carolinensis]
MNLNNTDYCNVQIYFQFCAFFRSIFLIPGLTLNIFILLAVLICLLSKKKNIKNSIIAYVVGSTVFNIVNLLSWPLMIDWRIYNHWRFTAPFCELMVYIKQTASTLSFYYVFCISFSIYLTIVFGYKVDEHRLFTIFQFLFPCFVLMTEEIIEHLFGWKDPHYDTVYKTCFTIINDKTIKIRMLCKILIGLPLTTYFYFHILLIIFRSAQLMQRSQDTNKKLAKMFSFICIITFIANIPGGILPLIADKNICLETATEFLFDLPIFTNPIILFCMNKELRMQCKKLVARCAIAQSNLHNKNLTNVTEESQKMTSSSESKLESVSSSY